MVTLSTKDNLNLRKQSSNRFKGSVYCNSYQTIPAKVIDKGTNICELLSASFQGVKNYLFLLMLLLQVLQTMKQVQKTIESKKIENYNVLIDRRNFYDQPINNLIKQYDEVRKVSTGHGNDYTTGCLLDYAYFKDNYRLIAIDLSKQKALDADPRAVQQIVFQGVAGGADNTKIRLYTILEKSKETVLEFYKGTAKVL